ncbi:MAG: hypothetical protein CGU29_04380 [Candidatus Dactylopiibacterium carminicum]|uniref:Uncharacterized protein n=1 Tax=Candidatus Dactylopiibacterium carminicum TaxID=857335 RepID=A0A272EVW8_9RHOO|nr:MAG: hypothetical protein CGU29_04380 [Candidatus Dactylopiibacterium carminicum]
MTQAQPGRRIGCETDTVLQHLRPGGKARQRHRAQRWPLPRQLRHQRVERSEGTDRGPGFGGLAGQPAGAGPQSVPVFRHRSPLRATALAARRSHLIQRRDDERIGQPPGPPRSLQAGLETAVGIARMAVDDDERGSDRGSARRLRLAGGVVMQPARALRQGEGLITGRCRALAAICRSLRRRHTRDQHQGSKRQPLSPASAHRPHPAPGCAAG